MDNCSLPVAVGALACAIADKLGTDELNVLAMFVTTLGDELSLISAQRQLCENKKCE